MSKTVSQAIQAANISANPTHRDAMKAGAKGTVL